MVLFHIFHICKPRPFLLKGLTSDIPSETMVFLVDGVSHERIDSTAIIDNKFEFKGNAHPYKEYWIETQYDGKFDYRHIYVECGYGF